jgi:hypothetical protein
MTGTTISGGITTGVTLTNPGVYNPVTILAGATITNAAGAGVVGIGATDWTIGNAGTVRSSGTAAGSNGIALQGGGTVANATAGLISGYYFGVTMGGAGTVVNAGSIGASVTAFAIPGTTARFPGYTVGSDHALTPLAGGIVMAGGAVSNVASGTISNYFFGVALSGTGTVTNQGQITAASTNIGFGVILTAGGAVSNSGGGTIAGAVDGVFGGYGGPTSITNQGTISGGIRDGLDLRSTLSSAGIANAAGATITGYKVGADVIGTSTIVNAGSVGATGTAGYGYAYNSAHTQRYLTDGGILMGSGVLNNGTSGTISDHFYGVVIFGAGTVANQGAITGSQLKGVYLVGSGVVTNSGSGVIDGRRAGALLRSGGGVYNYLATINSYYIGVSIAGSGTVVNSGSIGASGTSGTGTYTDTTTGRTYLTNGGIVMDGGTVINFRSGAITDKFLGIAMLGAGTVTNLGLISSTQTGSGAGVYLRAGGTLLNEAGATIAAAWNAARFGYHPASATVTAPAGLLLNQGTLIASDGAHAQAAFFYGTGTVSNAATGVITADSYGIQIIGGGASVTNYGSISATAIYNHTRTFWSAGVALNGGGSVTNAPGANISGKWVGVQFGDTIDTAGATLLNRGTIVASDGTDGAAVWMHGPGLISNASTGTISGGPFGIVLYDPTTVVNLGSISGSSYAISTPNGISVRVEVAPGASFTGLVSGGKAGTAAASSILELTAGASAGAITGFNSKYIGFSQVTLDGGATWTLGGTVAAAQTLAFAGTGDTLTFANPGSIAGTITGFSTGDTIVLPGITAVTSATLGTNNLLTVNSPSGTDLTLQFDPTQVFAGTDFGYSTLPGIGTALVAPVACFAAGTHIRTPRGARAVESLRIGDIVLTPEGPAGITWIGQRRVDCAHHARPQEVRPVRIDAGAFGTELPSRTLRLSPDHAVFAEGVLIPVRCLINGASIVQEDVVTVTYYHVALPAHGVLYAEDLACESYLDTGNRSAFENSGGATALHPDFGRDIREARGYADLVTAGPRLDALRRRLAELAENRLGRHRASPRSQEATTDRAGCAAPRPALRPR